jgi:pyruvate dehydrogenase E2 component (dihydrolipoamide acetyltransferase)
MPKLDLAMDSGEIVEWFKGEGENVREGEILVNIMTQKVTYEIASPANGILYKILAPANSEVPVGNPIAVIIEPNDDVASIDRYIEELMAKKVAPQIEIKKEQVFEIEEELKEEVSRIKISPAARKLAEEHGVDIEKIRGTGPEGRITRDDVLKAIEELKTKKGKLMPLTGVRKIIAERMTLSHRVIPPVTYSMEVDATQMVATINLFKEKEKIDLSYSARARAYFAAFRSYTKSKLNLKG